MKLVIVIPILYAKKNFLYKDAVASVVQAWKKAGRKTNKHSLEFVLVLNSFPSEAKQPVLKIGKLKVSVVTNELNRGFTGAVNDGVWFAVYQRGADWCLVLNDDAVVDADFFARLIPELKPLRSIISCGVRNTDGSLQSAGLMYLPSGLTSPLARFTATPYFSGTVFFVSKKLIEQSFNRYGWLLVEFFFAYAEDLELSLRLLRSRKKVFIYPQTLVTHACSLTAKRGSAFQLYWGYRNLLFVILLHWSLAKILFSLPVLLLGQFNVLAVLIFKGHWLVYPRILWSVWKNRSILLMYRKKYYEKFNNYYSF